MRYYIIAGERSGDLHGGNLVKSLKNHDPEGKFRGFGGDFMQAAGVDLAVHYRDLAFMGLVELLTRFNKIAKYIRHCKEDIAKFKPDVIILIDYGGFNLAIARFGRKSGIKVFFYIAPKYWAWYQNRALWLKPHVDRMFVILPFEKEFFKKFHWESDYVGNPVLDAIRAHTVFSEFHAQYHFDPQKPLIALLPGSRKQELKYIIPLMVSTVQRFPDYQFGLAAISNLDAAFYGELARHPQVKVIQEDTYNLLAHATAAVVTSGTATLETALCKVPQVVVYKANPASYWVAKWLVKVPYISLVNLIAGREVVKEMIQGKANPNAVGIELKRLVVDEEYRRIMINGYEDIIAILDTGGSASENAARLMTTYLTADPFTVI